MMGPSILQTSRSLPRPMVIRNFVPTLLFFLAVFIFLSLSLASKSNASEGSISVIPKNGSYLTGESFEADVEINGGGTAFNAAKADVSVSENLKIERLTLGNCGFAFVDTPTIYAPSFVGVILGGSKTSCILYTMTLRVIGQNSGFVFISDASLKSYAGAQEILQSVNNSSYTFGGSAGNMEAFTRVEPTQAPLVNKDGEKVYTLVYTIESNNNTSSLSVLLDPDLPTQIQSDVKPLLQDSSILAAVFENVPEGVHTIEVKNSGRTVSSEVVNVEGDNREINLGVQPKTSLFTLGNIALFAIGMVILIAVGVIGYIFYWKKRHPAE